MNYVTTNTTGCTIPIPNYSNSTYVCNSYGYKYKYNSCNSCEDVVVNCFYKSLIDDEDRSKAVKAIYDRGYITRDEANQLISERYAKRNECTTIYCVDNGAEIVIFCTESTSFLESETLFRFSYEKYSGKVTDENNVEEIN